MNMPDDEKEELLRQVNAIIEAIKELRLYHAPLVRREAAKSDCDDVEDAQELGIDISRFWVYNLIMVFSILLGWKPKTKQV